MVSVSSLGNAALNRAVARWPKETIWVNEMNGPSLGAVQWPIYGAQLERSELLPVGTPVTIVVDQVELCASIIWADGEKCGVLLFSYVSIQSPLGQGVPPIGTVRQLLPIGVC